MPSFLEKIGEFPQKFISNFYMQIQKNPHTKDIESSILKSPSLLKAYEGMQFLDFLLYKMTKDYPKEIAKPNFIDKLADKVFPISQYYGGIRDSVFKSIAPPFEKYLDFAWYKDFKVLKRLENEIIPEILKNLFKFENIENVGLESEETLKQLKSYILEQEEWINKEITLEDVRRVESKRIFVKNLKKTVQCDCEFTVVLSGLKNNKKMNLRQHYGASFDFIKDDGKWIATSFIYTPFN